MSTIPRLHRRAEVAKTLGCHPNTITRVARAHQIGLRGIYTDADVARLRSLIQPGPGCPAMRAGGDAARELQKRGLAARRKSLPGNR